MKPLSKNALTFIFTSLTVVLIVVTFISYQKINQYNNSVNAVMHTNLVKSKIIEVVSNLKDAQIGQRGYMLTNDSVFLQPLIKAKQNRVHLFAELDSIMKDNPAQQVSLNELKLLVDDRYILLDKSLENSKKFLPDSLIINALNKGKFKMGVVQKQISFMLQAEDDLLQERMEVKDRSATVTPLFLLLLSLFSILVITLFFLFLQREMSKRISITESNTLLQKSKQLIEVSEKRFRMLTETIPHMIWTAGPDGKKNFFNQYFLDYTGLTFEELKGDGMLKIIYSDDLQKDLQLWQHSLKTGEDFIIEKRIRYHDGTYKWHLSRAIAQKDNHGNITEWIGSSTEIDDQKKVFEALLKGENQFRTFANSIQNLAWISNAEGLISWYNQRWYDFTGMNLEELQVLGWEKLHHPDHIENVEHSLNQAWKTGEAFELTFPLKRHDGEYHWFLTRAYPVKDSDGNIEKWIGTSTDITEQKYFTDELEAKVKERTAELEERKNFVESILETSKEYVLVYSLDFTLIAINKAAETMIGKKREDLIGRKLIEIMPNAKGTKLETDLQSAFEGNSIQNEPYYSILTERYIENYITPLKDIHGNIYAALTVASDVSNVILKQKEIESVNQKLQLQNRTFEFAEIIGNFGSYKWDITTNEVEYSDNLFRLLDCEPQEFVPTLDKFLTFIHIEDKDEFIRNSDQTKHTGVLAEAPYRIISKTGNIKYFRSSGNFSDDNDNRVLIGAVQDISKDVEASKDLKAKNIELANANTELASFSYVASHDLQEPLRKIQGFSKRILDKDGDNLSETTKDYFNRINGAARRMQNLINSLLSFSRTNLSEKVFEKTDLNQTLSEVQIVLNELINQKNAVIESPILPTLNAVPVQMHQLFLNLISNSLKYSKPNIAPHIKISVEKVDKNENTLIGNENDVFWKLTFSDNGIGFDQQYENKIFELFQRLHGKTEYEGTGIGLALCKKIVQTHNGSISAVGKPGIGTTFTFFLMDNINS